MTTAVIVHELVQQLDSLDVIAFGDHARQWIIFADHVTESQRDMLRDHISTALGQPETGVRGLTVGYGMAAAMELTPYAEEPLLPVDGPGDYPDDRVHA